MSLNSPSNSSDNRYSNALQVALVLVVLACSVVLTSAIAGAFPG